MIDIDPSIVQNSAFEKRVAARVALRLSKMPQVNTLSKPALDAIVREETTNELRDTLMQQVHNK